MGRANVQVVSTRAGLHSLAHRYDRTISVFTKVSSSDRIILNQYSIRGDALWYALPSLPLSDANSGGHRRSRRGPQDSRLPRAAIAASSCGSGSPQPTTQTRRILTVATAFVDVCFHAGWFRSVLKMAALKSVCVPEKVLSRMPEIPLMRLGRRISAHAPEKNRF